MKIIAKQDDYNVLILVSRTELEKISGKAVETKDMAIGTDFNVAERWEAINELSGLPATVKATKERLISALKSIEKAEKACTETKFISLKTK